MKRRGTAAADEVERIERRRQPRDLESPPNWETIVLQRMARRIESLSGEPTPGVTADGDGGWEEAALRALRRRIQGLQSK
ncbi:MAG: hypothetical protein QG550_543 [Pseudomonadota bacterium]|jgi:hypothetical protein|nr:hypothetical protein [Pseudomonadota bacterium]